MAEVFDHGYAVVIGVNENNIEELALETVAKDVQALAEVLVHPERCAYDPHNVRLVKGKDATNKNIMRALFELGEKVMADPQATAVVYYSGHGMVEKETGRYYLIPYDIESLDYMPSDAIEAERMSAAISAIRAERMLVVFDCCHAAGMRIKNVDLEAISRSRKVQSHSFPLDDPETEEFPEYKGTPQGKSVDSLLGSSGRAILNSSTGDQSSYVRLDGEMSLFTFHLIEALNGHAPHPDDADVVLVTDVMSWVTHQVKKSAEKEGVEQTPVMRTNGVFPVAKLIGGQGVSRAKGQIPPHPLKDRPETDASVITFLQTGQKIGGSQYNITGDASFGQIGDTITVEDGDYVGRDKVIEHQEVIHGPKVEGDLIEGDKVGGDKISIGDISGANVAIGAKAQAGGSAQTVKHKGTEPAGPESTSGSKARRLQAVISESARIGQTHELMTMVALDEGPGLHAFIPQEALGEAGADSDELHSQPATITFSSVDEPVTLFIEIQASTRDFEIDEPVREVTIYPDSDSLDELFYLEPLRVTSRATINVRLLAADKRRILARLRLAVKIDA